MQPSATPSATPSPVPTGLLPSIAVVPNPCTDCWPTFEHDANRSGLQSDETGISTSTVAQLHVRWSSEIGEQVVASPVIAEGFVFVATGAGSLIAFDQRTGTPAWRTSLGGPITMTPLVDSGLVFVGTHVPNAQFFAVDAHSGAIRWQVRVPGYMRSAAIAVNGTVIVGQSGGDPPECIQGGVLAYQEMTGSLQWTWNVDSKPGDGGSVWTPISYGGSDLIFGTGNTCSPNVANANAIVRLTLQGAQEWQSPTMIQADSDDDFGGAMLLSNGNLYTVNKNGYFYGFDGRSGKQLFTSQVSPIDGAGSYGSPATNGSVFVVPTGFVTPSDGPSPSAAVLGFNAAGQRLWSAPTLDFVPGGAAITHDIAFLSMDYRLAALDVNTGRELWSYSPAQHIYAYASPAVVSTGVYYVDGNGNLFALSVGTQVASAATRTGVTPLPRPLGLNEPYGPILRRSANGIVRAVYPR